MNTIAPWIRTYFTVGPSEACQALGVSDRRLRSIGIVVLGCVLPFMMGSEFYTLERLPVSILTGIINTFSYWELNRRIVIVLRLRYPSYQDAGRRLTVQFVAVTLLSLLLSVVLESSIRGIMTLLGMTSLHQHAGRATILGLGTTYVVLLIYECIYFFNRWKASVLEAERLKLENVQAQLVSLKHQVNPHFLFNSLNTLASLIPKDPKLSVEFVQQLARVYRYVLEVNASDFTRLETEMDFARSYLFLLRTRHGSRLQVDMDIPYDFLDARVIPLSLQLLIENAVKHNVVSERKPLRIRITAEGGRLRVVNNLQRRLNAEPSTGLGLQNIRNRYLLLSGQAPEIRETETEFIVDLPLLLPAPQPA